jgi:hypothetical protein
VLVIRTQGAPQKPMFGGRRPRELEVAIEPEAVPTTRATLVGAKPFESIDAAGSWLDGMRGDSDAVRAEAERGIRELNAVMRLHRAAAADPYARDLGLSQALVARVGYGSGDQVAEGMFKDALELPRTPPKRPRDEALGPGERLAGMLTARDPLLACEELALRARADVDAGRWREAALQTRVALEAALTELPAQAGEKLGSYRQAIGQAANAALEGEPGPELRDAVAECVDVIQRFLRRRLPD